ncbi:PrpF protein [Pseudonocardia kujensis]|uniref:2-methylaconitate cis-trans isomerase PrpF family protein n=1 Tax=Pseudonocardia kujensis TaxID=1128675 RepID=UPI001E51F568|nr:PrpF domain-containing protein [Pseudonocardia kujensis]MCE0768770.1 PrpF protein [Pseudonocardia kujensis]
MSERAVTTTARPDQETVRLVLARGGTSKGLYLHEHDIPGPGAERDALLCRLMGSPDVLQVDGLGGSRPVTSKVAIIAASARDDVDVDVDYTFAQVDIETAHVDYAGNCGNISSGVGPFAVDEGLVPVVEPVTRVRIRNTNTDKILVAEVPVRGGRAAVTGDVAIPGVPGTGAPILIDWAATVGARTGRLLPTGHAVDTVTVSSGDTVSISLCDVGNPTIWVEAAAVGLNGSEQADDIEGDTKVMALLNELRARAAELTGLVDDWTLAEEHSPGLPLLGVVAPPGNYRTPDGTEVPAAEMDLRVRMLFMGRLHPTIPGTASMALTAASRVPGSVVARVCGESGGSGSLRLGHPFGVMVTQVGVDPEAPGETPRFTRLAMTRTARRLMSGVAYVPTGGERC